MVADIVDGPWLRVYIPGFPNVLEEACEEAKGQAY
jgi:hypothetical protein